MKPLGQIFVDTCPTVGNKRRCCNFILSSRLKAVPTHRWHCEEKKTFFPTGSSDQHVCGPFPWRLDPWPQIFKTFLTVLLCQRVSPKHRWDSAGPLCSSQLSITWGQTRSFGSTGPSLNGFGSSRSFRFCTYAKQRVSWINWYLLVVERRQNEFATSFHSVLSAVITWDSQQWSAEAAVRYKQEQECDLLTCDPQKR